MQHLFKYNGTVPVLNSFFKFTKLGVEFKLGALSTSACPG
jgi:hypothetical protein